jgi:hypothetical protein
LRLSRVQQIDPLLDGFQLTRVAFEAPEIVSQARHTVFNPVLKRLNLLGPRQQAIVDLGGLGQLLAKKTELLDHGTLVGVKLVNGLLHGLMEELAVFEPQPFFFKGRIFTLGDSGRFYFIALETKQGHLLP